MFVRPVTFVDYFEILDIKTEFSANLFLYDVDQDNVNIFILDLSILKTGY